MQKFNDSSRVCFLGDSITSGGIWIAKIFEYYKNAGTSARFYNLGIAGNTAVLALDFLEKEPFLKDATDVVIMFGMNDIKRQRYLDEINEKVKPSAVEASKTALEKLVQKLAGKNIILCSSTPHAEDAEINAALCEIAAKMKELAKNAGVSYIDFHKLFSGVMNSIKLIEDDNLHPNLVGNAVLANVFLSLQGFDVYTGQDAAIWEKEAHFDMCEENVQRFKAEAALRSIEFVKRIVLPSCKGDEEAYLDEYYKNCDAFFRKQISVYKRSKNKEKELFDTLEKYTEKVAVK
ncbi:MAG: hypothetical protein IKL42_00445 [Clostridia bacterium]|nr:hypothetical protein [Clostridia bacterium]